jgi:hypothetical protein
LERSGERDGPAPAVDVGMSSGAEARVCAMRGVVGERSIRECVCRFGSAECSGAVPAIADMLVGPSSEFTGLQGVEVWYSVHLV